MTESKTELKNEGCNGLEARNPVQESTSEYKRVASAMPQPSLIDAETAQAAMGIRGAAAAIAGTIFADVEPFDPRKAVTDLVGS